MKKSKFTEQQIAFALRQAETGTKVAEVCRKLGLEPDVLQLEEEVRRVGCVGVAAAKAARGGESAAQSNGCGSEPGQADAAGCAGKKILRPAQKRERIDYLQAAYRVSERRACTVIELGRSSHRYRSVRRDDGALRARIREIAESRVRYGYLRIHTLLRREGWHVNHKRVYRIYGEEGLHLRRKRPRRHISAAQRVVRPTAGSANECWSMDFVSDELFDGRRQDLARTPEVDSCVVATGGTPNNS